MPEAPAITLDDFARVTARLQSGVPRSRALEQAGIDENAWLSAQQAWLTRIATQAAAGDRALHERFLARLEAHQQEEQSQPKKTPKMALPLPPAARRARPAVRPKKPATPAPRIVLPAVPAAPQKNLFATMAFEAIAPTGAALPFVKDDDAEETLEPEPPRKKRLPRALPFEAEDAVASSTLDPPASVLAPEAAALPFKGGTSKARKDPSNSALPFRKAAESDSDEDPLASTVTGDDLAIVEPALPFDPVTPKPRKKRPVTGSGLPFRRAAPPVDNASTTMLSADELAAALAKEDNPDPLASTIAVAQAREQPRLTLEQFASLTAEVGLEPQQEAKLEQRYGLPRGGLAREKAAWAFRFLDDAKLSADYIRKIREYRTWLQKRR